MAYPFGPVRVHRWHGTAAAGGGRPVLDEGSVESASGRGSGRRRNLSSRAPLRCRASCEVRAAHVQGAAAQPEFTTSVALTGSSIDYHPRMHTREGTVHDGYRVVHTSK